jgi:ribosomal protein S18 acetylase RimI-like enzyme
VSRVREFDGPKYRSQMPVSGANQHITAHVRPIIPTDLRPLMRCVGPLVDSLYPAGAILLLRRLEDALAGYALAHVAALDTTDTPIAVAAEAPKGGHYRKLSTFWVSTHWRRQRVGSLLIEHLVHSWLTDDVNSVHVTVREDRSQELTALLRPWGFRSENVVYERYGEGRDELVLRWNPYHLAHRPASACSTNCVVKTAGK